jgi:hypothetical protein
MEDTYKNTIGLTELIRRIKKDLLADNNQNEPDLFSIDEVTLEVNFVINGDIDSGFNFGIVSLGSQISEERVQKVTIKMTPLVSKSQLLDKINSNVQKSQKTIKASSEYLIRGTPQSNE